MKKTRANKLQLHSETVRELKSNLSEVVGGIATPTASRICHSVIDKCNTTPVL